ARHLLAVVLCRQGRYTEGAALLDALLADDPANPRLLLALGDARHEAGDPAAAAALFARLTGLHPTDPALHNRLGVSLLAAGRGAAAIEAFRRTLALDPGLAQGWFNLGTALQAEGDPAAAIEAFHHAVSLAPDHAEAWLNLGAPLLGLERESEALAAFDRALTLRPDWLEAATNRGVALERLGRLEEAVAWQQDLARRHPDRPEPLANLGTALHRLGRIEPALAATRAAAALAPDDAAIAANLALIQNWAGDDEAAAAGFARALARAPDHPAIHYNYAQLLLRRGDFTAGWAEYEWRWRGAVPGLSTRRFSMPRWRGEALAGRTLLVHAEQGLGDTLHFVRFLPRLAASAGGRVVLEAQAPLLPLLRALPGLDAVIAAGDPLPACDCHLPLLSLPYALGLTRPEELGMGAPYLAPPPERLAAWRDRLPPGRRIGLVWAGNPRHKTDSLRSLDPTLLLERLGPALPAVPLSLQKEGAVPPGVIPLGPDLKDFGDTAAVLAGLDLLISVDTAIVHLAGALGRPAWVLLPFHPDWRWQRHRADCLWYPSLRLFRQPAPGDWAGALDQVAAALAR
ncbi:MAG: hypothetical protein RLZZ501_2340, partial [Pseudomonadota bacterium]